MAASETSPPRETPPAQRRSRMQDMVRSLHHRNFQLFFSGQLISLIGTWMDTIAEAWLVYRLTHSSLLLGIAGFASQIPVFLLAPRSPRKLRQCFSPRFSRFSRSRSASP
jgi:hypothetical protein